MQVNQANITRIFEGLQVVFESALHGSEPQYSSICMTVPSSSSVEIYSWLAALPGMREFVGEAQIQNAGANTFTIPNRKFESTIALKREDIERDALGFYNPLTAAMAVAGAQHPDDLLAEALLGGFTTKDYTTKNFFDVDKLHNPDDSKSGKFSNRGTKKLSATNYSVAKTSIKSLKNGAGRPMGLGRKLQLIVSPANEDLANEILKAERTGNGATNVLRNTAELVVLNLLGDSQAWFLQEAGNAFRPLVFQPEVTLKLNSLTKADDSYVLLKDEFLFQAYARYGLGYGLSQLIWGSTGADAA